MFSHLTLLSLFLCIGFAQCTKHHEPPADNPYGLPNATQTGAGVFASRINGVNAIAKNNINNLGAWMSPNRDTLNIAGSFGYRYFQEIMLGSIDRNRIVNQSYSLRDS